MERSWQVLRAGAAGRCCGQVLRAGESSGSPAPSSEHPHPPGQTPAQGPSRSAVREEGQPLAAGVAGRLLPFCSRLPEPLAALRLLGVPSNVAQGHQWMDSSPPLPGCGVRAGALTVELEVCYWGEGAAAAEDLALVLALGREDVGAQVAAVILGESGRQTGEQVRDPLGKTASPPSP